jgi:hypothetical protein
VRSLAPILRELPLPVLQDVVQETAAASPPLHNRPLFWDGASYLLYRCWSAMTPSRITWRSIRRQLASIDQHDRRLAAALNHVADEIQSDYPDFPAQVEKEVPSKGV